MKGRSLRFRMMFLFCLVVGVLFAGTYIIIYSIFATTVADELDRRLLDTAQPIVADLEADPSEQDVFTLDVPNQHFELLDTSGKVLQSSRNLLGKHLEWEGRALDSSKVVFHTVSSDGNRLRMALIPFYLGRTRMFLAIATPTQDTEKILATFRRTLLILLPVSLLLTGLMALWYVGRSLRPIVNLTYNAAQLTEAISHPERRVAHTALKTANPNDELGRLSQTFNVLFENVNSALAQLRQFVTDASHELRTPLAVLRGETELILSQMRTPEEYEKTLRIIDNELKLLDRIVQGLFTLSMADAGQLRLSKQDIYVDEILEEACEMAIPLARPKAITIEYDLQREIRFSGDEAFLRQLFLIFLDNALKYSPPNTRVCVKLDRDDVSIRAQFRDQGPGIPAEHLPHIFERFYRVAETDSGETRSGGLGLAIAQAIARAQGGSIQCETKVGTGSTFSVILPAQAVTELSATLPALNSN